MTEFKCEKVLPYTNSEEGKKEQISKMFDHIADVYDPMNRLMSLGQDKRWRKKAIQRLGDFSPKRILDVATGTGDFAIQAAQSLNPDYVLGIDISEGMMEVGKQKVQQLGLSDKIFFEYGDSTALSLPSDSFDAVTVAFGVRNFSSLSDGLKQMAGVLKKGGVAAILEMTEPENVFFKLGYKIYTKIGIPVLAKLMLTIIYQPPSKHFPKEKR
jgi:demethylmenaquinone methyltransferase/2-methoxy-6-polyprenyl-1,4-benzoquinol methylase